uniref:Uncharacterized protein n=1 Tax=Candidatus Kentrum sp. SD TaxID=2126332 RepID=A0A450Z0H1_9GAMM|nr:MAG: hypothetical protein BECKSD772F_GA0070984_107717 [Candidatus Kentron sp. SD]VFK47325.1 MAG: hypothetical protein BECKSD772E_GA0070983_10933 [Candidatus Kentron sp. SD]
MLNVEYLPPLDPGEIKALYKALPGYQAVTDDTARLAEKYSQTLNLDSGVLADLNQGLADVHRLEPAERVLEKLYLSVYHQRLQATSRCMGGMYDTARCIRDFVGSHPRSPRRANSFSTS